jgi:hypothetical protein
LAAQLVDLDPHHGEQLRKLLVAVRIDLDRESFENQSGPLGNGLHTFPTTAPRFGVEDGAHQSKLKLDSPSIHLYPFILEDRRHRKPCAGA